MGSASPHTRPNTRTRRSAALFLFVVAGMFSAPSAARAERLVIRLINANTGRPMEHQNVLVEWDADAEESTVYVGGGGKGELLIVPGSRNILLKPATKNYGDPNRLSYFSCTSQATSIPLEQAVKDGYVTHNDCTGRTIRAKPGEVVFWAHPLPLWKPDFQ